MRILAIETSCDETGAAVVERNADEQTVKVLSNITATSIALHASTGGIIPENAAREQVKFIIPTIVEALLRSEEKFNNETIEQWNNSDLFKRANNILKNNIDAIAVTHGPGLVGSLLVGVETAKTLAYAFDKPLVAVHHLLAHIFANFISPLSLRGGFDEAIPFPFIGLIVSGGHTDLLLFESFSKFKWLGGTLDDAAGEALDKIGRLLNLSYPAGPEIEQRASKVQGSTLKFQSPVINSKDFNFSFSGLKAEVARFVQGNRHLRGGQIDSSDGGEKEKIINEVSYATQKAIIDVLIKKTIRAAKMFGVNNIVLGGGVSANNNLRNEFELGIMNYELGIKVFAPEKVYATDNAAMIGAYALLNYKPVPWTKISAEPELYFS